MTISASTIYLLSLILMLIISAVAYSKAPKDTMLPMQWGTGRQINWSAPAKWAVLIIPALAAVTIGITVLILAIFPNDDSITASLHTTVAIIICLPLLLLHLGHMYFSLSHVK